MNGKCFREWAPALVAAAGGLTAEECIFVGDHPAKDVAGAKAVGMRAVPRALRKPVQCLGLSQHTRW